MPRISVPMHLEGWLTVAAPGQSPREATEEDLRAAGWVPAQELADAQATIRTLDALVEPLRQERDEVVRELQTVAADTMAADHELYREREDSLRANTVEMRRERDEARAVLREIQWSLIGNRCPVCRESLVAFGGYNGCHAPDCALAAALGEKP